MELAIALSNRRMDPLFRLQVDSIGIWREEGGGNLIELCFRGSRLTSEEFYSLFGFLWRLR